ncbi:MAG: VWA domain-containing protein [Waddliaceae bacterium]
MVFGLVYLFGQIFNRLFAIDPTASFLLFIFGIVLLLFRLWGRLFQQPQLRFSNLADLTSEKKSLRLSLSSLPSSLLLAALILFSLAFIDPHFYVQKKEEEQPPIQQVTLPTEGIAIYLVLDQSGSMGEEITALSPEGKKVRMTKLDLLKQVTEEFVKGNPQLDLQGRPNDMLGLVAFARGAQILSPLTLDHQAILDQLSALQVITDQEQDGTAIGYAVFKAANLISATRHYAEELEGEEKPAYHIENAIMILITDGIQAPNPLDQGKALRSMGLLDAAEYAKQQGVRMYMVNVEPKISSEEFAPYRNQMKEAAEMSGGKFYLIDSSYELKDIYADIDRLEKSILPVETQYVSPPKSRLPHLYDRMSLYPYLIGPGLISLVLAVLLESVFMRRVP